MSGISDTVDIFYRNSDLTQTHTDTNKYIGIWETWDRTNAETTPEQIIFQNVPCKLYPFKYLLERQHTMFINIPQQ